MISEQISQFLTLFIEKCWHDWSIVARVVHNIPNSDIDKLIKCCQCGQYYYCGIDSEPSEYLKNKMPSFGEVKNFTEQKYPNLWELYLQYTYSSLMHSKWTDILNSFLSITNVVSFLLKHPEEWGWLNCPRGKCEYCGWEGRIKHPALSYAEKLMELKGR